MYDIGNPFQFEKDKVLTVLLWKKMHPHHKPPISILFFTHSKPYLPRISFNKMTKHSFNE